jgi:23S rRNA (guanosine2251-2'-O)-methyltransferase
LSNFIYGKYPVQELLKLKPELSKKLWYISDEHLQGLNNLDLIQKQKTDSWMLRRKFALKEFESPQGLLLELKSDLNSFLITTLEELIIECSHQNKFLIWLPAIQDGHNLGAIIRSSVALANVGGIIIPHTNSVKLTPSVAKVSAGAIFNLKFAWFKDYENTAKALRSAGFKLLAIQKDSKSLSLPKVNFSEVKPFILILGSEEKGIPRQIQKYCDLSLQIPQTEIIDSLNMSVAAAIVLYEITRAETNC